MNFVAYESVDRSIVERLRQEGIRVLCIAELGPGMPDDEVLKLANQEAALLRVKSNDNVTERGLFYQMIMLPSNSGGFNVL